MAPDTTNGRQACTTVEPQHFDLKEKMKSQNEIEKIETNIQNHISDTNQIQNDKCNVQTEDEALLSVKKPISNNIEEDLNNDSNVRHRQIENKEVDEQKEMEVSKEEELNDTKVAEEPFKSEIRWPDFIVQIFLHAGCLYGLFLVFAAAKFYTSLFAFATIYTSGFGITAGAHRLWSHRAYKAKWPLRLLLVFLFTITGQRDVYTWALDHRVHHKYTETDSDPHDARRGFFFSHVGWLFLTPHPEVVARRKAVDMSDLEADPIVMWQKRLYVPLFALLNIIIPVLVPVWLWQETIWNSFWVNFNCRFTITLNIAFFVNSVAHMWGQRPYDKNISPVENMAVAIAALGEGWHNYHHVFPWDYKTGELGDYSLNLTTGFIDFFAKLGWAYDRKSVSSKMIARRAIKNGDGSFIIDHHHMESASVWGYGDKDIPHDDMIELDNMKDKKD